MEKIVKPKHYRLRLYAPYAFSLVLIITLQLTDSLYHKAALIVFFVFIVLLFGKVSNSKEVNDYFEREAENKTQAMREEAASSSVNENIEKYLEAQRLKRASAKWWQFWG